MVDFLWRIVWTLRWYASGFGSNTLLRTWRASGFYVSSMRAAGFKVLT